MSIKLLDVITIYIGGTLIEQFKKEKLSLYKRIIQQYHVLEFSNAHSQASFWNTMLNEPSIKNAGAE